MRKILQILGMLSIFIGILLGIFEVVELTSDKKAIGNITNILQRKSGTEYHNVKIGNVYPCKLEVFFKDNAGEEHLGKTSYESEPCSKFFTNYYRVGDRISIVYSENNPTNVKINSLFDRFGFLIILPLFGLGLIYFSTKMNYKKTRS